ncbi:MAG: ankyrin repeat domain-containing protein [Alphaproteobacteria bacterium]|nr:ankyrin repeat domain-containing protein [Alphaproteobacteria bacterium]
MKLFQAIILSAVAGAVWACPAVQSAAAPASEAAKARAERLMTQMQERRRYSGFMAAARDNKLDRLRELVKSKDIDVNWRPNGTGVTALMTAANQGYVDVIDILIGAGADPLIEMWNGWTALAFAAQNGKTAAVKRLLAIKPAPKAKHIQLALFAAARNGRPATGTVLVKAGGRLDSTDEDGLTPLHLAAKWGQPKTVQRLLRLGALIDARDRDGRTALFWAAWQGHEKVVDALQSAGADAAVKDKHGATAFGDATTAEQRQALVGRHWSRTKPTPKACSMLVGNGIVWRSPDGARVNGYGFYRRPATGTSAWLIPNDGGAPIGVTIGKTSKADTDGGPPEWNAELTPNGSVGEVPKRGQRGGVLLWPAPKQTPKRMTPILDGAPFGVFPGTIEAAIDTDGDGRPDVLSMQFCCKNPSSADKCEYTCGAYWQRSGGVWRKCQSSNPA